MPEMLPEMLRFFVSPGHNYFGHHGREPDQHPTVEVEEIECVAGCGIRGDRFFSFKPDYIGQVTFFADETYQDLCQQMNVHSRPPAVFRRNILTRGVDLSTLMDCEFELQGVRFRGHGEAKPCYWMNQAFAPGAQDALQGRGGLRAVVLSDGWLRRKIPAVV
ncbi:MAG TPA: MOSC domain-containing protein [Candidatus Didemnitutus sp.]|nr:MOSC domain-containing protein [Candidatus Didemnitutus sp.]